MCMEIRNVRLMDFSSITELVVPTERRLSYLGQVIKSLTIRVIVSTIVLITFS